MSQMPDPNMPLLRNPQPRRSPQQVAASIGTYVKAFITIMGWGVVGTGAVAAAWVCLKVILWAVQVSTEALGV